MPRINIVGLLEIGSKNLGTVLISRTTGGEGVAFDGSAVEDEAKRIITTFTNMLETRGLFDFEVDDIHGEHLEGHGRMSSFRSEVVSATVPEVIRFMGTFTKL